MKKRILSLVLCTLIVATLLVSCGKTDLDKAEDYINTHSLRESEPYVTLNLYIPVKSVSNDAAREMQNEFNKVIEPKYKTRIAFHLVPEAEYEQTVKAQAALAKENAEAELDKTPAGIGDNFPKENNFQFDIFVATGKSMIQSFISADYLMDLTEPLTTTYNRKLSDQTQYNSIPSVIYENAVFTSTVDGNTVNRYYGVPSNFLIGQYTYYIINKENADKYYFNELGDLESRIANLKSLIEKDAAIADKNAYIEETIQTVQGDYRKRYEYSSDEYYVEVKDTPVLDTSRLYEGMFCISSMCRYKDRAMQVISEIYTNPALHTTLQYGASNVTYKLSDTTYTSTQSETFGQQLTVKTVEQIGDSAAYQIDVKYTGNIVNLYTCSALGYDPEYGYYLSLQNKDATAP